MSRRMMVMLALVLGLALLILLDKPQQGGEPEVSQPMARAARVAASAIAASTPRAVPDAVEIPDLFAVPGAPAPVDAVAPPPAAPSFSLLGFKEEDGVREAYLLFNGDVILARVGVVLEKRYQVLALESEFVRMKDKESGTEIRIGFGVSQ